MEYSTKELLGLRIKELRKTRGLTQRQLADKVNIDPKHLSRLEVGNSFPSIDTLERLANVLEVELRNFFEFSHKAGDVKGLKKLISELIKNEDKHKLRLAVKILNALLR